VSKLDRKLLILLYGLRFILLKVVHRFFLCDSLTVGTKIFSKLYFNKQTYAMIPVAARSKA